MIAALSLVAALASPIQPMRPDTPPAMPVAAERITEAKSLADVIAMSLLADGTRAPAHLELPILSNPHEVRTYIAEHYPAALRGRSDIATPWAWVMVDTEGRTSEGRIVKTSGNAEIDALALAALAAARFRPATLAGSPVGVWIPLPIQVTSPQ